MYNLKSSKETERLRNLEDYNILDTTSDKFLDGLTKLASIICESPIALISLVDENRQWFKSKNGLDIAQTSRDVAFCHHAIQNDEILQIEDAAEDERVRANPLVTGDPYIRFYAGAPLISKEGYALGTLCVIDRKPKKLNKEQLSALKILSDLVIYCFEGKLKIAKNERSLRASRSFISNVSEDMRKPINEILGFTEIMIKNSNHIDSSVELNNIRASAEDLHKLIIDILDFQNIRDNKIKSQEVVFDLKNLVNILKKTFKERESNDKVKFRFNFDVSIPEFLVGDPQRINQILYNIIKSSIEQTDEGNIQFSVELEEDNTTYIATRFIISDTSASSDQINEQFEGDIKLEIASKLVKLLGGELLFQDLIGGRRVYFTLKLRKALKSTRTTDLAKTPDESLTKIKVLLAEDLDATRLIISKFLDKWNINHDLAINGIEAVDKASHNYYDIIIMDLRMPEKDGFQAAGEIFAMQSDSLQKSKIIALTSMFSDEVEDKIKEVGFSDTIIKPFNPTEFKTILIRHSGK